MKFFVLPDSFKGSISSSEFCEIAKNALSKKPDDEVLTYPICDGGEGSVECLVKIFDGKTFSSKVTDGNLLKRNAVYGYCSDKAFVSVAESSGLAKTMIKDPFVTTTYGMGEQILHAKHLGKKKIVLCLGGSSTNDGGAGLVKALGGKFFNKSGEDFLPTGGTLKEIDSVDLSDFYKNIEGMEFTALCDVTNPLLGPNGCTYVYAPQKGAKTAEKLSELEDNMRVFAEKTAFLGADPTTPGAGAAGGLGDCVIAFLKGKLVRGIDFILDSIDFEKIAASSDVIITGEGKYDASTAYGKAVRGIQDRAERVGKKVYVFCGKNDSADKVFVRELNDPALSLQENMKNTAENLSKAFDAFYNEIHK